MNQQIIVLQSKLFCYAIFLLKKKINFLCVCGVKQKTILIRIDEKTIGLTFYPQIIQNFYYTLDFKKINCDFHCKALEFSITHMREEDLTVEGGPYFLNCANNIFHKNGMKLDSMRKEPSLYKMQRQMQQVHQIFFFKKKSQKKSWRMLFSSYKNTTRAGQN